MDIICDHVRVCDVNVEGALNVFKGIVLTLRLKLFARAKKQSYHHCTHSTDIAFIV
jgi:hypothetical protein